MKSKGGYKLFECLGRHIVHSYRVQSDCVAMYIGRHTIISVIVAPGLCIFSKKGPLLEQHAEI